MDNGHALEVGVAGQQQVNTLPGVQLAAALRAITACKAAAVSVCCHAGASLAVYLSRSAAIILALAWCNAY